MAEVLSFEEAQIRDFYVKLHDDKLNNSDAQATEHINKIIVDLQENNKLKSFEDAKPIILRAVIIGLEFTILADNLLEILSTALKPLLAVRDKKSVRRKIVLLAVV